MKVHFVRGLEAARPVFFSSSYERKVNSCSSFSIEAAKIDPKMVTSEANISEKSR